MKALTQETIFSIAQALLLPTNKWGFMKLKSFCVVKKIIIQSVRLGNGFFLTNYTFNRWIILKIYKELKILDTRKIIQIKMGTHLNKIIKRKLKWQGNS